MLNLSVVMDNGTVYNYFDVVSLTLQHDFNGNGSVRFFVREERKDHHGLCESSWSIGENSDVEAIVIKKG